MTGKEFMKRIANGKLDILQTLLDILAETDSPHAVIGGLAVNAYAEPVVSLDLDIVIAAGNVRRVAASAASRGLNMERFGHSVNLSSPQSDLRIQLQTDPRYQEFIPRAQPVTVLGYAMRIAALEDVLRGKVWAYQDGTRRKSERQEDLADIAQLIEARPELESSLPSAVRGRIR